jgi:putative modified peptide
MSQRTVERVIGRLVTDEAFRRRFAKSPESALREATGWCAELTASEVESLAAIDVAVVEQFADALDPRLQKADIEGGSH